MSITVNLDGTGRAAVSTKIPFLDHMLDQIASHGLFDITVDADGDTWIDDHHTNEDIGLALGTALAQALGDRKGITRFGDFTGAVGWGCARWARWGLVEGQAEQAGGGNSACQRGAVANRPAHACSQSGRVDTLSCHIATPRRRHATHHSSRCASRQ